MKTVAIYAALAAVAFAPVALDPVTAKSDERPSAVSKTMLDVVVKLADDKQGPVTDISFDDGQWEVEIVRDGVEHELNIDAATGDVVSEHEEADDDASQEIPKDAMALTKVLTSLVDAGYAPIVEASLERTSWEVEAYQGDAKRELHVDLKTGKVLSDRADD